MQVTQQFRVGALFGRGLWSVDAVKVFSTCSGISRALYRQPRGGASFTLCKVNT